MMKRFVITFLLMLAGSAAVYAQEDAAREATREQLRQLLNKRTDVAYRQSEKQPYNFTGVMTSGLTNTDSLEIVASVSPDKTLHIEVYPHYNKAYINVDKARNGAGLTRLLVNLNYHNFLYWAADDTGDIYAGYTFTLESGFPDAAINIVLESIKNTDGFVGRMKPFIDGTTAPAK